MSMMNIVAIIQARMGSTRLPGKVLLEVEGRKLLEILYSRLKRSKLITEIIIATTTESVDDAIIDFCQQQKYKFFRGSEQNVLSRYYDCAVENKADVIVRITSDCPLIDPNEVDRVIEYFNKNPQYDLVSNTVKRTFPRGMDTAVFNFESLASAYNHAETNADKEHVTKYIYDKPETFNIGSVTNPLGDYNHYRLTVDTIEDYKLIEEIIKMFSKDIDSCTLRDIINILDKNPSLPLINSHIEQKKV
jgi:spore coat polysaccharide biosynthesis protein SpsF